MFTMTKSKLIENWTNENAPLGRDLGYPECCIKEFCEQPPQLMKGKPTKDDRRRYKAAHIDGHFTGFIPCRKHAKEITMRRIKLSDLITNRTFSIPFPSA